MCEPESSIGPPNFSSLTGRVGHQRPGIVHSLYDWSDDMEFMEIIMPGDFATTEITPPALAAAAPPAAGR
jgi:hypothetical protein